MTHPPSVKIRVGFDADLADRGLRPECGVTRHRDALRLGHLAEARRQYPRARLYPREVGDGGVTYFALGHCHNPTIRAASSATPRHHNAHFSKPRRLRPRRRRRPASALTAPPATARDRVIFGAASDFGFIYLDETGERAATRRAHAAAQHGANQPRRLLGAESELALPLQGRDAIGVGSHQRSGPEPGGQRQLGVMHDGSTVTEVWRPQPAHS